ncbi:MAG TPA: Ig-like domain-containing protein [Chitinispirillaceae bacterium]|nr:Ig-like domain-containing protein [Chitinispirillaceae bacterium]
MKLYFSGMLKKRFYLLLCSSLLLVTCARQLSPSGGPEDKSSPVIQSSSPASSSLNVPVNSKIDIYFSEWVSKKTNNIVSIYPPLKHKVIISKNRLQILPLEPMSDSQTYHIIISSNLQDFHGNALPTSYSLVFSTGVSLDSGLVNGCIIDQVKGNKRYQVALYRNEHFSDSGYLAAPSYKIESDTLGKYQFDFIKAGLYRIIAYVNSSPSAKNDMVYTSIDSVIHVASIPDTVFLYPSRVDTAFPIISSIKCDNRKYAYGVWSKDVDTSVFKASIHLFSSDSSAAELPVRHLYYGSEKQFALIPEHPFSIAQWRCIYSISRVFDTVVFRDTMLFNSTDRDDTLKPSLKSSMPSGMIYPQQKISLIWSEPVLLDSSMIITDTLGDTVYCSVTAGYRDTLILTPRRTLKMDALYRLFLFKTDGIDLSGNELKAKDSVSADTVAVIKLSTINSDSVAISISGDVQCSMPEFPQEKRWVFEHFGKNIRYVSTVGQDLSFHFDSIPAGMGKLTVFNDRNSNNQIDPGVLIPWKAPEPFVMFVDTVEARARWEVEGIKLGGCKSCFESPSDSSSNEKK